jgi:hypothetical protein
MCQVQDGEKGGKQHNAEFDRHGACRRAATAAAHHQGDGFPAKLNWHVKGEDVVWVNLLALPIVIFDFEI